MQLKMRKGFDLLFLVCVLIFCVHSVQAAIPVSQRNALIDLYNSTNGDNWSNNTDWLGAVGTECSWFGVYCNFAEDAVTEIRLHAKNLTGSLPDSLADLTHLTYLDFYDNRLTGSIPSILGSLVHLQVLRLESNQLTGAIPASFGDLSDLRSLLLGSNSLSDVIPASLGKLAYLDTLWLSNNQLSGSIPSSLGSIPLLRLLLLDSNQLTGEIPQQLGNLLHLSHLWLNDNELTGSIPVSLGNLLQLTELHLGSNQLTGSIPAELGNLSKLTDLALSSNQLSGSIPAELGALSLLEWLNLSFNQLTGQIPAQIGNLAELEALFLHKNQLTGPLPDELGNLSSVQYLWLISNQFTGELPVNLMNLSSLYNGGGHIDYNGLYITDNPKLTVFVEQKFGAAWASTQTLAPTELIASNPSDHSVWLSWNPVTYTAEGGYNIYIKESATASWKLAALIESKSTTEFPVTGLNVQTSYDFRITSFTHSHADNHNIVVSDSSALVTETTSAGSCSQPAIDYIWRDEIVLSVNGAFDTYEWSTGETIPTIVVAPIFPAQWYWVKVTFASACEEIAVVLVEPGDDVFLDDFESGTTSAWSSGTTK